MLAIRRWQKTHKGEASSADGDSISPSLAPAQRPPAQSEAHQYPSPAPTSASSTSSFTSGPAAIFRSRSHKSPRSSPTRARPHHTRLWPRAR
ncbi:hypothetical protein K461DRAFT_273186 [Myriangium duriaei CBS 260.36]|uniref:Uncharacterized protein n=1 Tax=Myriangium duriaei CBS 260.36 TaxID=1168546 RepID=A0A9P4JDL8_9PEZI|nr:hypothetical protein K461DRAFT_273186 [Myriangium duriaei CBS 260.36]